jgi:hypothetical protein
MKKFYTTRASIRPTWISSASNPTVRTTPATPQQTSRSNVTPALFARELAAALAASLPGFTASAEGALV